MLADSTKRLICSGFIELSLAIFTRLVCKGVPSASDLAALNPMLSMSCLVNTGTVSYPFMSSDSAAFGSVESVFTNFSLRLSTDNSDSIRDPFIASRVLST